MKNPIRQHYVPQVYLKNFSIHKMNAGETIVIDRKIIMK